MMDDYSKTLFQLSFLLPEYCILLLNYSLKSNALLQEEKETAAYEAQYKTCCEDNNVKGEL